MELLVQCWVVCKVHCGQCDTRELPVHSGRTSAGRRALSDILVVAVSMYVYVCYMLQSGKLIWSLFALGRICIRIDKLLIGKGRLYGKDRVVLEAWRRIFVPLGQWPAKCGIRVKLLQPLVLFICY